ncbi:DUF4855 domain-containing protein [Thermococcus sp.]
MATFGLWYFRWDGERNVSLLGNAEEEFGGFFDYAVALPARRKVGDGVVELTQYTGDGFLDGKKFAEDVFSIIDRIQVYIAIPYWKYNTALPRDAPAGTRGYWVEWIRGVISIAPSNLKGFYWSLESAWMLHDNLINANILKQLSNFIHSNGLKFIWIPYARTRERDNTDIHQIYGEHWFNYIFVQPNYYFSPTINSAQGEVPYTYDELEDYVDWILEGQLYIAMEADEGVITGCGNCRKCTLNSPELCKKIAGDYIRAQKDVMGKKFYHRAYYFGTSLTVISEMNRYCKNTLGENYV